MAYKAPGKHYREGLSTRQFFQRFPDDKTAEAWFIKRRWPEEVCCPPRLFITQSQCAAEPTGDNGSNSGFADRAAVRPTSR